jgi:biotin carboxyl carrier protein
MLKKYRINVEGRIYNVAVEELPSDGVEPLHAPVTAAPTPALSTPTAVAPPPAAPAPMAAGAGDEVAPLAGVIFSIDVGVGAKIQVGDKIAVIEAMKMKTDVFAKHGGTVTKIAVSINEGVETGQRLLTIG